MNGINTVNHNIYGGLHVFGFENLAVHLAYCNYSAIN